MTFQTSWANKNSPYTDKVPFKEVAIPVVATKRKGQTKYDAEFEKLLEFKTAIETTEGGFEVLRRAMQRFVKFRQLEDKISIRRQLNRKTRAVVMWMEPKEK